MENKRESQINYEEWLKKIHKASGVEPIKLKKKQKEEELPPKQDNSSLFLGLFIFLVTLLPRLYFLFFVSDPQNAGVGWYGDTYHHWQIAYLTKEVGLSHGFLRLWDLKGMEFFWGLGHPLFLMIFMAITGSSDIIVTRLLSLFAGSGSVALLFLIAKRYWGTKVAVAAAIFGALNPVSIFNDASGSVEPFGMVFLFLALYFWPKKAWLTGIFLTIASMSRAEFWLFSGGLVLAIFIFSKQHLDKKSALVISYFVTILLYMKYLLVYTGNAIYPIWWNFLGNAKGEWQADIPLMVEQQAVQPIWIAMFVFSFAGIIYVLWKRSDALLLHLLGLGSFLFLGFFVGFTAYLKSYLPYFWVVRIFSLPYLYLGALIAIFLFIVIPRFLPLFGKLKLGWVLVVLLLAASQTSWFVIWHYFNPTEVYWEKERLLAEDIKRVYKPSSTILIHEGDPVMTYAMVKYARVQGKNIEGQMYDPFQYEPFNQYQDLFENWSKDREIILNWLKKDNIKLLVFHSQRDRYLKLVKREPEIFKFVKDSQFGMKIYEVKL